MKTTLVPREHIHTVWDRIKKYVEKCAKYTYGRYTADDILEGLLTKDQHLWIAFDNEGIHGFWVTEVSVYPQMRALTLHFVGGRRFKEWASVGFPPLQKFAKELGCDVMESFGRPGWKKMWEGYGYNPRYVFYELPVE